MAHAKAMATLMKTAAIRMGAIMSRTLGLAEMRDERFAVMMLYDASSIADHARACDLVGFSWRKFSGRDSGAVATGRATFPMRST
jgi:hypothetical protein